MWNEKQDLLSFPDNGSLIQGLDKKNKNIVVLRTVLGKVTFKSNTLQYCVTP